MLKVDIYVSVWLRFKSFWKFAKIRLYLLEYIKKLAVTVLCIRSLKGFSFFLEKVTSMVLPFLVLLIYFYCFVVMNVEVQK